VLIYSCQLIKYNLKTIKKGGDNCDVATDKVKHTPVGDVGARNGAERSYSEA